MHQIDLFLYNLLFLGRVFVTMLGYPSRCEKRGISHACTLAVACWWVGGSSQTGCGTSPWIVACCVVAHPNREVLHQNYDFMHEEHYQRLE